MALQLKQSKARPTGEDDWMHALPPPPIGSFWGDTGRAPGSLYGYPARLPSPLAASDTDSSYCVEVPKPHQQRDLTGKDGDNARRH